MSVVEDQMEFRVLGKRLRREMSLEEKGRVCKAMALSQKSFSLVNNVIGDIKSIPVVGKAAGGLLSGVSLVTHLAAGGFDIAQTAIGCGGLPFEKLKVFMQKNFNEMNRKLDSQSAALEAVSRMVNKTLSAVEKTREEMNERFDEVLVSIEETKIEPIVSKINNFVRYFETEKERIRGLSEHDFVTTLEDKHGIMRFFKESRTPMCDNSLNNALFDIIKHGYAVPDSSEDEIAFKALYALLYGTEAHVSVMAFLLEHYAYLASYHYKRGEIDQYNECFDSMNNIFSEFKSSLVGIETLESEPLLDQVIQTLIEVKNLDFLILERDDVIQMLNDKIDHFNAIKEDIRSMVPTITTKTPSNYVHVSFDNEIDVPIGEWEKYKKVQYAVQYKNESSFSRLGEWSQPPLIVNNYACPILRMGNDPYRNTILIFRKFTGSKPHLVGSVEPYQQEFVDVDRDLYNAAENPEKKMGIKDAKLLLEKGANFTVAFERGRRALHAAAGSGNVEIALNVVIRARPEEINVADDDGYTPMHLAADTGNSGFVKLLIDHNGSVNMKTNRNQLTPLHLAARRGFIKTFYRLLESPQIDINALNSEGFTPLHYAVLGGKFIVDAFLKNEKTAVNPKSTKKELTPFHMAVINDDLPVTQALIESRKVDVNVGDKNNMTPLHYTAMLGHSYMTQYLLSLSEINPNLITKDNKWTPLHYAIFFKQDDIALMLLDYTNLDYKLKAEGNYTPLHFAVVFGRKSVLLKLLTKNVNLEAETKDGYTALHLAAMQEDSELLTYLLDKGANIKAKSVSQSTPLHLATFNGRSKSALTLLDRGAEIKVSDKDGQTPIHGAALNNQLEVIKSFVSRDSSIIDIKNKNLDTPLNIASQNSHTGIVKYFVEKRADINTQNNDGITPLIALAKIGNLNIVKYLLDKGADVYMTDKNGYNFLYHAIKNGHLNIVQYVYKFKQIDWSKTDDKRKKDCTKDCSIEYFAICDSLEHGKLDIVKYFIGELEKNKCEPLPQAALFGQLKVVKYLVEEKGFDVNPYKDYYNPYNTPLCSAAKGGSLEVVKYLVAQKADIHSPCNLELAIDRAIENDHLDIVKFLSENGANLRQKNRRGNSPLYSALGNGRFEIAKYFIEKKTNNIDINERDMLGDTPLITVVFQGRLDVVKSLVEHGADVNIRNNKNESALDLAKRFRNFPIVDYLESRKSRFLQQTLENNKRNLNFPSNLKLNEQNGYLNHKYISAEEGTSILTRSHVSIRNVDVIGTLMLLDVIIRYFTNQEYISGREESVSEADAQATALKMTEKFEDLLNLFQDLPDEQIDFSDIHKNIYKALMGDKQDQLHQVLCSSMKTFSSLTEEEMDKLLAKLTSLHPSDVSLLSVPSAEETFDQLTRHCLQP